MNHEIAIFVINQYQHGQALRYLRQQAQLQKQQLAHGSTNPPSASNHWCNVDTVRVELASIFYQAEEEQQNYILKLQQQEHHEKQQQLERQLQQQGQEQGKVPHRNSKNDDDDDDNGGRSSKTKINRLFFNQLRRSNHKKHGDDGDEEYTDERDGINSYLRDLATADSKKDVTTTDIHENIHENHKPKHQKAKDATAKSNIVRTSTSYDDSNNNNNNSFSYDDDDEMQRMGTSRTYPQRSRGSGCTGSGACGAVAGGTRVSSGGGTGRGGRPFTPPPPLHGTSDHNKWNETKSAAGRGNSGGGYSPPKPLW